ncbi:MAG TPA: DUF4340 domain-containing protein [Steroidobacteraceae bacterium]|nr:DUF4340 domain-containing protein [Steroidobacteraceae bacterium]
MNLSSRGLTALLAAGATLIAIALWVSSRNPSPSVGGANQPVLPGLEHDVNAITQVKLAKGDGSSATLEKRASDWLVAERGYPADSSRVRKLLLNLADLKVLEQKTSDPANYPDIGVEDVTSPKASGTRIDLVETGKTVSLIVGKLSGTDGTFVRVAGAKQSALASPQLTPDADPRRWLDSTLIELPQSRIKEVTVKAAAGPAYSVTRASAKEADFTVPGLPKGRELTSPSAPDSVAGALASLSLDDVRKAGGPGTEPARATFETFDGLKVDVTGRKDGDNRYIGLTAESSAKGTADEAKALNARLGGWEVEIPGYQYDAIFQPLDGLLKKPEPKPVKAATKPKENKAPKPRVKKAAA